MSQVVGKNVGLMISDPWDFGTECGVGPFYGKVTDSGMQRIGGVDIEAALVRLDRPIYYSNTNYLSAICHVRHEGTSIVELEKGLDVSVNITLLPKEAQMFREISDEGFRKGFAATGSLELV